MNTSESLKNFLTELIDYAGLFPPAGLNLDDAISNYLNYLKSEFGFALSRFVIPVSRLNESVGILKDSELPGHPLDFSLLTTYGKSIPDLKKAVENDIISCKKFNDELPGIVNMNSFEVKLPEQLILSSDSDECYDLILFINEKLNELSDSKPLIFLEGNFNSDLKSNSGILIDAVNKSNLQGSHSGFKLRTGGLTPEAFPDSDLIAFCIRKCLDRKVPMKFTAGLHHPLRHYDKSLGTMMHGFLNVFGAGITAMRHDITDEGMAEMLEDEYADNFKFTDDHFSWKGWDTGIEDIDFARRELVLSYGSCSFDEPIDDLKALKLIN